MRRTEQRRLTPSGKDRRTDRAMIVTVVTEVIRTTGQVIVWWIRKGGRI
jgi:hypothetical protein